MMLVTETKNFSDFPVGLSGDISDHDNVTGTRQAGTERVPARSVYLQEELTVDLNDLKYKVLTPHFPIITGVYEDLHRLGKFRRFQGGFGGFNFSSMGI